MKTIREQLIKLDAIYDQLKAKFATFKSGSKHAANELLKAKLDDIDRVISAQASTQSITSTMTGNLTNIIENIRECLSCRQQGGNNDTNLSFGDSNKFFLYSQSEGQKKTASVADQIVFMEPTTYADGSNGLAFVFDKVYGVCTPTILENHVATAAKKYREIKKALPECKLSFVIPDTVIFSCGATAEKLTEKLSKTLGKKTVFRHEKVETNIAASAMSDHYIEFGSGEARVAGKREVNGLVINLD